MQLGGITISSAANSVQRSIGCLGSSAAVAPYKLFLHTMDTPAIVRVGMLLSAMDRPRERRFGVAKTVLFVADIDLRFKGAFEGAATTVGFWTNTKGKK